MGVAAIVGVLIGPKSGPKVYAGAGSPDPRVVRHAVCILAEFGGRGYRGSVRNDVGSEGPVRPVLRAEATFRSPEISRPPLL